VVVRSFEIVGQAETPRAPWYSYLSMYPFVEVTHGIMAHSLRLPSATIFAHRLQTDDPELELSALRPFDPEPELPTFELFLPEPSDPELELSALRPFDPEPESPTCEFFVPDPELQLFVPFDPALELPGFDPEHELLAPRTFTLDELPDAGSTMNSWWKFARRWRLYFPSTQNLPSPLRYASAGASKLTHNKESTYESMN